MIHIEVMHTDNLVWFHHPLGRVKARLKISLGTVVTLPLGFPSFYV
jgi:hypothetical protein